MSRILFVLPIIVVCLWIAPAAQAASAPPSAESSPPALQLVSAKYRKAVAAQLEAAGANRSQWIEAIKTVPETQRTGLAFLLANMPAADLESLTKDFLLTNLRYAYRARAEAPWGAELPEEIFLNDVLPYASINEHRDDWRKDFYDRFMPLAKKCKTPGEAALLMNRDVFRQFNVRYSATKRPKPDQSPYESAKAKYASCTGLSVMAVDACRAVAVPARLAGVPLWTGSHGNHSWTEVWDGSWRIIGSAESTQLDQTWFGGKAAQADPSDPMKCLYATSYARTGKFFPMVWDLSNYSVPAFDVTALYKSRRNVNLRIVDAQGKPAAAGVTLRFGGQIVAAGSGKSSYEFMLAGGLTYEADIQAAGKPQIKKIKVPKDGKEPVELKLPKK